MTEWGDTPMNHRQVAFECVAYGPTISGLCYWEGYGICSTEGECDARMGVERNRLWEQLLRQAEQGDEWVIELVAGIAGPDDLLGGPGRSTDGDGGGDQGDQAEAGGGRPS